MPANAHITPDRAYTMVSDRFTAIPEYSLARGLDPIMAAEKPWRVRLDRILAERRQTSSPPIAAGLDRIRRRHAELGQVNPRLDRDSVAHRCPSLRGNRHGAAAAAAAAAAANAALKSDEVVGKLRTAGFEPLGGGPDEFRQLVDRFHQAGIGVIVDWVPAHFPKDTYALAEFDGTDLYEHLDPRQGEQVRQSQHRGTGIAALPSGQKSDLALVHTRLGARVRPTRGARKVIT